MRKVTKKASPLDLDSFHTMAIELESMIVGAIAKDIREPKLMTTFGDGTTPLILNHDLAEEMLEPIRGLILKAEEYIAAAITNQKRNSAAA